MNYAHSYVNTIMLTDLKFYSNLLCIFLLFSISCEENSGNGTTYRFAIFPSFSIMQVSFIYLYVNFAQ